MSHRASDDPEHAFGKAQQVLGEILLRDGQVEEAIATLTAHAEVHSANRSSAFSLATAYQRAGNKAESARWFGEAARNRVWANRCRPKTRWSAPALECGSGAAARPARAGPRPPIRRQGDERATLGDRRDPREPCQPRRVPRAGAGLRRRLARRRTVAAVRRDAARPRRPRRALAAGHPTRSCTEACCIWS